MQKMARYLRLAIGVLLVSVLAAPVGAKSPAEKALRDYEEVVKGITNVLEGVKDQQSAQANLDALAEQVEKMKSLQSALTTKHDGNPNEKPKSAGDDKKSKDMTELSKKIEKASERMAAEIKRVLSDPALAEVVGPTLGQLGN